MEKYDSEWLLDYRVHALEAFAAGVTLTVVSRFSHILAKPGALVHESYMSFYSYLVTTMLMPMLMLNNVLRGEARKKHFLEDVPIF